jgi:hypothetical protein
MFAHHRLPRRTFTVVFAVGAAATLFAGSPAGAVAPCPPDTNCSGAVDADDLTAVILQWGQSGTPADVDGSGSVDSDDLTLVILGWGQCTFDYQNHPNQEAHQIGLEMLGASGPLVLPAATYERINRDLGLIRAAQPALAGQIHTPAWASSLIIGVTTGADLEEVECLNTYYQGDMTFLFGFGGTDYHVVQVAGMVNIPALCAIYAQAQHVQSADPDGIIGGENFWVPTDMGDGTWAWNIDDGFHDCFDGCDCHNVYEYHVAADGQVTLVSFSQWGMKWCEF